MSTLSLRNVARVGFAALLTAGGWLAASSLLPARAAPPKKTPEGHSAAPVLPESELSRMVARDRPWLRRLVENRQAWVVDPRAIDAEVERLWAAANDERLDGATSAAVLDELGRRLEAARYVFESQQAPIEPGDGKAQRERWAVEAGYADARYAFDAFARGDYRSLEMDMLPGALRDAPREGAWLLQYPSDVARSLLVFRVEPEQDPRLVELKRALVAAGASRGG